jgi:hypothetical protein
MGDEMTTTRLQRFIDKYGPVAGPKLYHALQSRAAYIGANSRRRTTIAGLSRTPVEAVRPAKTVESRPTPLLAEWE